MTRCFMVRKASKLKLKEGKKKYIYITLSRRAIAAGVLAEMNEEKATAAVRRSHKLNINVVNLGSS